MIYSVIEHPCRRGRNAMATPTVWNVRAAPAAAVAAAAAAATAAAVTTTASIGMFMLLPLRLYLVAALLPRCSSSVVAATDAASTAAATAATIATIATVVVGVGIVVVALLCSYLELIRLVPPCVHYR